MTIIQILKVLTAIGTIAFGALSIFLPQVAERFTGLRTQGGRGTSEIRAVLGGTFVGAGAALLIFNAPDTYRMMGIIYLAIGIVRAFSMLIDKSVDRSNTISLISELIFGALLVY